MYHFDLWPQLFRYSLHCLACFPFLVILYKNIPFTLFPLLGSCFSWSAMYSKMASLSNSSAASLFGTICIFDTDFSWTKAPKIKKNMVLSNIKLLKIELHARTFTERLLLLLQNNVSRFQLREIITMLARLAISATYNVTIDKITNKISNLQ